MISEKREPTLQDILKEIRRMDSKIDFLAINQEKLCRYISPGEKYVKPPNGLPNFPLKDMNEMKAMEKFLENDANLSATVSMLMLSISVTVDDQGPVGLEISQLLKWLLMFLLAFRVFTCQSMYQKRTLLPRFENALVC